ncbi:serine/threonine protein kinase [Euhalothece natronophila Z-M001]|uniref:non-specific serine/threonine protein kinase n=2 Tax=Euhalothece TaxID=65097 RepID=A0A5B8NQU0_9CHRO|nr:serine/threonine protein kinase [Euhalothece natronophila Z-M001]
MGMTAVVLNNRYRVVRELGQGGFGQTFLAIDTHLPSERYCVIKQLYPIVSRPKQYQWIRERFQREAAILEALSRGNSQIPQLYAYFAESETFYLVQEYIEGLTLTEQVEKSGVLSEKQVTKILISLLKVLDYVHSQHIIHRDVKPDNIILRAGDSQPVLIDFGVVKEALGTVIDSERTHSIAIGTPGYMPSEQAAGRPVYSSDLYSLALTAVFLLSGEPPHTIESDPRTGELLWRKAVPRLHGNLAGVIDRALRFNPRDRFADANEMLAALMGSYSYTTEKQSSPSTLLQSPRTEVATVAATPYRSQSQPQPDERKGNSFLTTVAIIILIIFSAGGIGYGMVQIVEGLRQGNNDESVVTEPSPPLPSEEEETDRSSDEMQEREEEESPEPEIARDLEIELEPEPEPEPEPEIELEVETPVVVVPTAPVESDTESDSSIENVPVFTTGVSQEQVVDTLGEPTASRPGYWPNTQTLHYRVSPKLDLGFIFDRDTERLRQTEASFDPSVDLTVMEARLNQMLRGQLNSTIREALAQVYNGETDLRSFTIGEWKGIIQKNNQGRIYMGVWEQDLP